MKKLSVEDREMLWNDEGPYSEAKIIINTRILDDSVSRVTIEVEGNINPTTFKIIEKHKDLFANDPIILQLLKTAVYRDKGYGYNISAGVEEYIDEDALERAQEKLEYTKQAII